MERTGQVPYPFTTFDHEEIVDEKTSTGSGLSGNFLDEISD